MTRVGLLILAAGLSSASAGAQSRTGRLEGTVLSVTSGRPVGGVIVSIPTANRLSATDDSGAFSFDSLPSGTLGVYVAVLGRSSSTYSFALSAGKTKRIQVLVDPGAVELEPIVVRASNLEHRWGMSGFYARRRIGFGYFITREQIETYHYTTMQQALGTRGVTFLCGRNGCNPTALIDGQRCRMMAYVDGLPAFGDDLTSLPTSEIAGIEVYRSNFDTPTEFSVGGVFNGGTVGRCGSVVVWTRDWRSDLPEDW